jgi:hypothetical protein
MEGDCMKRILQIDGGGVKGIIPLATLVTIEKKVGPLWKYFDLMTGTSTGSIICGMLAAGVPAQVLYDLYTREGEKLFKKNNWFKSWFGPKYLRDDIQAKLQEMVRIYAKGPKMGNLRTNFVSTTFNGVTGRTHFQMSWDDYHKGLDLVQVISWSALSAVYYFGPICVPDYLYDVDYQVDVPYRAKSAVFYDGGQGRNNCTLNECITTCVVLDYLDGDGIHILSLGCGAQKLLTTYEKAKDKGKITELKNYLSQERREGVYDQLHKAKTLAKHLPKLNVYRLDCIITEKEDRLDALEYIPTFIKYGASLESKIPDIFLRNN